MLCSIVAVLLCAIGVIFLKQETRSEYLWVLTNDPPWDHFKEHTEVFGGRRVQALLLVPKGDQGIISFQMTLNEHTRGCRDKRGITRDVAPP